MKLGSNLEMNNDREPTITIIRTHIAELNKEIKTLSDDKFQHDEWNVKRMNVPLLVKKYNSTDYSIGPKGVAQATKDGWWGKPGAGGWGANHFPNDNKAWWISNNDYNLMNTMGYFYYVYNSPTAKRIGIYTVIDDQYVLKVNGQTVGSLTSGYGLAGDNMSVDLVAGKNVFEFKLVNTGGPGAFVFYAYEIENKNNVYFRSGDPGWGYRMTPTPDYKLINNNDTNRDKESGAILERIDEITELIESTFPLQNDNITYTNKNIKPLLTQFNDLQKTYAQMIEDYKKPMQLQGDYEVSTIQVQSNFSQYTLYILFTLFIIGSLFHIFKNPEVGNLDMFILALALMILAYYVYEYIQMRKRR